MLISWLLAWIYATDAGLIFLDTFNFYIDFVLLLMGFLETFCLGWMFGSKSRLQV